jgi:topoisomerase IV subunit A
MTKKSTTPAPEEIHEDINQISASTYAQQAYLDYAMSVVCGRAIPYLEDGQKPVQRRTLYAMNEMRLTPEGKPVKSAKIIGTVLGSYHPHGDQSVYDAMVRQTQSFVMRYPLVHGEGNFGSRDGDGAAAMRYCFTGDTRVMTEFGLIKMDALPAVLSQPNDNTGTINKNFLVNSLCKEEKAVKWLYSGRQKVCTVTTAHGYKVKCTPNEPLYTLDPKTLEYTWRTVESLRVGEPVALNRRNSVQPLSGHDLQLSARFNQIPVPKNMSFSLARLLGLLFGCIIPDVDSPTLLHLSANSFVRKEIFSLAKHLFPNHVYQPEEGIDIDQTPDAIDSFTLIEFLSEIGFYISPLAGQRSIPEFVFRSSVLEVDGFLSGFFQTVRAPNSSKHEGSSFSNEIYLALPLAIIDDVKSLLLNYLGCVSDLPLPVGNDTGTLCVYSFLSPRSTTAPTGVLPNLVVAALSSKNIPAKSLDSLRRHAQSHPGSENLLDIGSRDYLYDPITSIEYHETPVPVYDLTVENTHAFVANGFIAHNTEAKLSLNSKHLLKDLGAETVDFRANYDGTTEEPEVLPARLPFILMNGAEGVGVGMASSIPPHRAREITNAAIELLKNPEASFEQVMTHIEGPDFPTGGHLIQSREKILSVYKEGNGTLKLRGSWVIENGSRGNWKLIISALPYGVSAQKIMEQVDALLNPKPKEKGSKKEFTTDQLAIKQLFSNMIDVYRDESGKEQAIRVVFEPKSNKQNPDDLVQALLSHTGLQDTVKFNFVVVGRDRRPAQMGIVQMIKEWGVFRVELTQRRLEHEQRAALRRLHIVEGRIKVLDAIQEAIRVIQSSDDPKKGLMERFDLSEEQAQDVLEMRLRQLARMEGAALTKEKNELEKTISKLKRLLAKRNELVELVIQEINDDVAALGEDLRLTKIEPIADADEPTSKAKTMLQIPEEPLTVAISEKFWVRAKTGLDHTSETFVFKTGDPVSALFSCTTRSQLFALDHTGRVYCMDASEIPSGRGGEGLPLSSVWDLQGKLQHAWMGQSSAQDKYVMASDAGHGFIISGQDLNTRLKAGKAALTLAEGALPLPLVRLPADADMSSSYVVSLSSDGSAVAFPLSELPSMGKGKGVALLGLRDGCKIVSLVVTTQAKVGFIENGKTKYISGDVFMSFTGSRSSSKKGKKIVKTTATLVPPTP